MEMQGYIKHAKLKWKTTWQLRHSMTDNSQQRSRRRRQSVPRPAEENLAECSALVGITPVQFQPLGEELADLGGPLLRPAVRSGEQKFANELRVPLRPKQLRYQRPHDRFVLPPAPQDPLCNE